MTTATASRVPGIGASELLPYVATQRLQIRRTVPEILLAPLARIEPDWHAALGEVDDVSAEVEACDDSVFRLRLLTALSCPGPRGTSVSLSNLTMTIERRGVWNFDLTLAANIFGFRRELQRREGLYAARRGRQLILARHDGRRLAPRLGVTHLAQGVAEIEVFTEPYRDRVPDWASPLVPARISVLKLIPQETAAPQGAAHAAR